MINNFDTNFLLKHPEKKYILNANCLALQTFSKFSVETHITFVFFSNSSISNNLKKRKAEAIVQRCSVKKVFLKILHNSLENTSFRPSEKFHHSLANLLICSALSMKIQKISSRIRGVPEIVTVCVWSFRFFDKRRVTLTRSIDPLKMFWKIFSQDFIKVL